VVIVILREVDVVTAEEHSKHNSFK